MRPIRPTLVALALAGLVVAGCGNQDQPDTTAAAPTDSTAAPTSSSAAPTSSSAAPSTGSDTTASSGAASSGGSAGSGTGATPASTRTTSPLADRTSNPQVAADRLLDAWLDGDRSAAGRLASQAAVDRLFAEAPPAQSPRALPCRLANPGTFVCSYPLAQRAELSMFVTGGASAGYRVSGIEFGD
jgi:hypothetical protein